MAKAYPPKLNSGSRWHRWDPHIHAPGTALNDQFKGKDGFERYLNALESAIPPIRAIGVTDYYGLETYERVVAAKASGRLAGCDLIFPNVEMRLSVGTVKGKWANIHLLVSPDDPKHVSELKRFLQQLTFMAHGDTYTCTNADLIRLGKRSKPELKDDASALAHGCEQFKVNFNQLRAAYKDSAWAQANILVAVAGSETDGTSGIRDAADTTLRQEVEKFAHVVFASSAAQREFWLGRRAGLDEDAIRERYGGLKPCLHGSDAHEHKTIGMPDGARYSWLKGDPAFDTLRQACIDPAGRAFVGDQPPVSATPSQVIAAIEVHDAPWASTPSLELNPGLVAIIGARGSGKTALADIIAAGCNAISAHASEASFLRRASDLLGNASVTLGWQDGAETGRLLDGSADEDAAEYPRARYLSQQFVEELCSAHGMTDELIREIERVIFEAHPMSQRDGAVDFDELLDLRASRFRQAREREEESLGDVSERIGIDIEKGKAVGEIKKQVKEKENAIKAYTADRSKLVAKGSEARVERLGTLTVAADKVRSYLRYYAAQEQALLTLQDEVGNVRSHSAPEALRKAKERHKASDLDAAEWQKFLLDYKGDVDAALKAHLVSTRKNTEIWKGIAPKPNTDINAAFVANDAKLNEMPLAILEAEISRLERLVSVDRDTANRFAAISRKITEEAAALDRLKERLADCEGAKERVKALAEEREAAYVRVFEAIQSEQSVLIELYRPLMARLSASAGTLKKLSFSVSRDANAAQWAAEGEELLDLRRQGTLKGRGTLLQLAEAALKEAWETGNPATVSAAMAKFFGDNRDALLEKAPIPKTDQANYRDWAKRFAKWLYGTQHVRIQYSIDYDGVDIRKLSPGTRGIVLLLLYLALDDADDRPLIIDQPEENLDPKSIFDELVGLFRAAKSKRQVIMVTHNANLVVNTDADQVVVAQVGPHQPGKLPPISYVSGGLENAHIRTAVCNILEGGERAFQERARRLRVKLDR